MKELLRMLIVRVALIMVGILIYCGISSYIVGLDWAENDPNFVPWLFAAGLALGIIVLAREWLRKRLNDGAQWSPFQADKRPIKIALLLFGVCICALSIFTMKEIGWFWLFIAASVLAISVYSLAAIAVLRRTPLEPLG